MLTRPWSLLLSLALALSSAPVYADEPLPRRPIEWVGVEVNPLATLVRQFGGQVQVGVVDAFSVVGSVAYVSRPHTRHYDGYDDRVEGSVGERGIKLELGPRFHVPLRRRMWLWIGPSFYQQRLASPVYDAAGRTALHDSKHWVTKVYDGATLDAGVHAGFGKGGYVSGGAGAGMVVEGGRNISYSPRLLLSVGWGY